jgi:hypothetical protein
MTAKFNGEANQVLEMENVKEGVTFFSYEQGEEEIGQLITVSLAEINNIIKFLQSANVLQ